MKVGLTFDDVLLLPRYSEVLPTEVDVSTRFSRSIPLNIPIVSAAMDTVTEADMAIAIAQLGGIGVIHRNLTPERQAEEVRKVKRSESWIVENPYTLTPDHTVQDALRLIQEKGISGIPIVQNGHLVGLVTRRDVMFIQDATTPLRKLMKTEVITAPEGISIEEAKAMLIRYGIEKLPVVDAEGRLKGLITLKDILKKMEHPHASLDREGHLRVAAAVGTGEDAERRVPLLLMAGVDAVVIDTAHGHSRRVLDTTRYLRSILPDHVDLVVGNIVTEEAARDLVKLDVDAVKVGVGPGSICTTRVVAGVGMPQLSAIMDVARVVRDAGIPLIADGGIRYSGDIVKALAAGADTVMIGSLLAGTDEAPGEVAIIGGRRFKTYRGMGSLGAMAEGGAARYGQEGASKFVPEGVEGVVPYRGRVADVVFQLVGGLRSGMGYVGASNLEELRNRACFVQITHAGVRESHPHDVLITREAPNYSVEITGTPYRER